MNLEKRIHTKAARLTLSYTPEGIVDMRYGKNNLSNTVTGTEPTANKNHLTYTQECGKIRAQPSEGGDSDSKANVHASQARSKQEV